MDGNTAVDGNAVMVVVATGAVLGVVLLWAILSFNRFVSQRHLMANSWSNVETELRRRYDLIPNLVETVRGYAGHEQATLTEVIEARRGAVAATGDAATQAGPENVLVEGLRHLMAVSEDRIQAARRLFNGNVRDYNRRVESIPSALIAAVGRFARADYFEVEPAVRVAGPPPVNHSRPEARRPSSTNNA